MKLTREITDKIKRGIDSGKIPSVMMSTSIVNKDLAYHSLIVGPVTFDCKSRECEEFSMMGEINKHWWDKYTREVERKEREYIDSL